MACVTIFFRSRFFLVIYFHQKELASSLKYDYLNKYNSLRYDTDTLLIQGTKQTRLIYNSYPWKIIFIFEFVAIWFVSDTNMIYIFIFIFFLSYFATRFLFSAKVTYVYSLPWGLDAPLPLLSDSWITLLMSWPSPPADHFAGNTRQSPPSSQSTTPWELSWFPLELFLISPHPFLLQRNESPGDKIKTT